MNDFITKKTFWSSITVLIVILGGAFTLYDLLNQTRVSNLKEDQARIEGELAAYKSDMSIEIKDLGKELKTVGETVIRIEETLKRFK